MIMDVDGVGISGSGGVIHREAAADNANNLKLSQRELSPATSLSSTSNAGDTDSRSSSPVMFSGVDKVAGAQQKKRTGRNAMDPVVQKVCFYTWIYSFFFTVTSNRHYELFFFLFCFLLPVVL
jgi:hypothetical protein